MRPCSTPSGVRRAGSCARAKPCASPRSTLLRLPSFACPSDAPFVWRYYSKPPPPPSPHARAFMPVPPTSAPMPHTAPPCIHTQGPPVCSTCPRSFGSIPCPPCQRPGPIRFSLRSSVGAAPARHFSARLDLCAPFLFNLCARRLLLTPPLRSTARPFPLVSPFPRPSAGQPAHLSPVRHSTRPTRAPSVPSPTARTPQGDDCG